MEGWKDEQQQHSEEILAIAIEEIEVGIILTMKEYLIVIAVVRHKMIHIEHIVLGI